MVTAAFITNRSSCQLELLWYKAVIVIRVMQIQPWLGRFQARKISTVLRAQQGEFNAVPLRLLWAWGTGALSVWFLVLFCALSFCRDWSSGLVHSSFQQETLSFWLVGYHLPSFWRKQLNDSLHLSCTKKGRPFCVSLFWPLLADASRESGKKTA